MNWERGLFDFGADAGGAAEMGEVGGETVADVQACSGQLPAQERLAYIEARLRKQMRMPGAPHLQEMWDKPGRPHYSP